MMLSCFRASDKDFAPGYSLGLNITPLSSLRILFSPAHELFLFSSLFHMPTLYKVTIIFA